MAVATTGAIGVGGSSVAAKLGVAVGDSGTAVGDAAVSVSIKGPGVMAASRGSSPDGVQAASGARANRPPAAPILRRN
jgi:hypothetical protein